MKRDPIPARLKLGFAYNEEMRAIRAELAREGVTDPAIVHFRSIDRYMERHKNDPTLRERQEAARARGEKWVAPEPDPNRVAVGLTRQEVAYLVERLAGVNDPLGQSAAAKLAEALS